MITKDQLYHDTIFKTGFFKLSWPVSLPSVTNPGLGPKLGIQIQYFQLAEFLNLAH